MHPDAQKDHKNLKELKWKLDALQIHAKLQPTEVEPDNNLLKELDKDYGMFDDNKRLHMRNINNKLSLHDVVNFHEIITSHVKDSGLISPINKNLGIIVGNGNHFDKHRRPQTAKANSNSSNMMSRVKASRQRATNRLNGQQ